MIIARYKEAQKQKNPDKTALDVLKQEENEARLDRERKYRLKKYFQKHEEYITDKLNLDWNEYFYIEMMHLKIKNPQ